MPRRSRLALLATMLLLLTPAGAAAAAPANDFLIVLGKRLGPYRMFGGEGVATFPDAVTAFGTPTRKRADANLCTVRWPQLGLVMGFAGPPRACSSSSLSQSAWYGATVTDRRWRTLRGLRVGDTEAKLKRTYPNASRHTHQGRPAEYWLATYEFEGSPTPWLSALVRQGEVVAIEHHPGYLF